MLLAGSVLLLGVLGVLVSNTPDRYVLRVVGDPLASVEVRLVVDAPAPRMLDAYRGLGTWVDSYDFDPAYVPGDITVAPRDLADMAAIDALVADVEAELGGIDILVNNAGRSIRRPLAESLERWHDVERTIALNYYGPLRLIRGLCPGMRERGDGHVINVATWGVKTESPPLFGVYNASKAALSSVSRIIETEWGDDGVHSTTLYYPLVKTPMIAPTRAYDGLPGLSAHEAAGWIVTAARHRPVSIAPRVAVTAAAVNSVAPAVVDTLMKRQRMQPRS